MELWATRDAYFAGTLSKEEAIAELYRRTDNYVTAQELVDLWECDLQARSTSSIELTPEPCKTLQFSQALELIDDAVIHRLIPEADAIELWKQIGLKDQALDDHVHTIDLIRRSRDQTWTQPLEAPSWIRQLSALARMFMHGEISSRNALLQLDPLDEYPHVAGAILAHLIDTRDNTEELASLARKDPKLLHDGIEYCRHCGRARASSQLSRRGLCKECQDTIACSVEANLKNHSGPYYRRWRDAMLQAMYLLEDEAIEENREPEPEPEEQDDEHTPRHLVDYINP